MMISQHEGLPVGKVRLQFDSMGRHEKQYRIPRKILRASDSAWQEEGMERYPRDDLNVRHTAPEAVALSGLSYGGTMHSGCHVLY